MRNKNHIHIIATGGTIDSKFYPPTEKNIVHDESRIPVFLTDIIKPHIDFSFEQVAMVDSTDITDQLRQKIGQSIDNSEHKKILITHGTNTMTETLRYLQKNLKHSDKVIILTGAMIPLDGYVPTDAGFNLGYAIAQLENKNAGIYIAMNGKLFENGHVVKNFTLGRFEFKDNS